MQLDHYSQDGNCQVDMLLILLYYGQLYSTSPYDV